MGTRGLFLEAAFGLLLLSIPLLAFPAMLYLPCAYIFVGKFLFGPAISALYRDPDTCSGKGLDQRGGNSMKTLRSFLATTTLFAISSAGWLYGYSVQVRGKGILVDGKPFTVKGMHTVPGVREQDLRLIRSMNVNTIFVSDPPTYVLRPRAASRSLREWVAWGSSPQA